MLSCTHPSAGVTWLRLDRPQVRNALDRPLVDALVAHLDDFAEDDAQCVLVIGATGTAFCSGADLQDMDEVVQAGAGARRDFLWRHMQRIPRALERIDKPVIAAVNGPAYGAGMDLALMCDLRIAARSARFASSFIKFGLLSGDGGAFFLTRLVGVSRSLELLWSGRTVDAPEAQQIGLVAAVVDDNALDDVVATWAKRLAGTPLEPLRMIKRSVYEAPQTSLRSHLDLVASHMAVLYDDEAFQARFREAKGER